MDLPPDVRCASTRAAAAQLTAAVARLEAELPEAECAAQRSLEALRLEDPAAMSGCWNPGCAAGLAVCGRVPWNPLMAACTCLLLVCRPPQA